LLGRAVSRAPFGVGYRAAQQLEGGIAMDFQAKHGGHMPGHFEWPGSFFLPAPMAMFGAVVAFMLGIMVGVMVDKKRSMHGQGMTPGRPMMGGGPPWMHMKPPWMGAKPGMATSHHHHGFGMPECCETHGDWMPSTTTGTETPAEPTAG
jgi:hypothetical protein